MTRFENIPSWLKMVCVVVIYFATAWFGLIFATVSGVVSPVWPPSGLALAVLLLGGWRMLPAVALGIFFAEKHYGHLPAGAAFCLAIGNSLEAALGVWLLRLPPGFSSSLSRSRDVVVLAFGAALLAPCIAASVGALTLWKWGVSAAPVLGDVWLTWWAGDALGILVITPLILSWWQGTLPRWNGRRTLETLLLGVGLALVCKLVFSSRHGGEVSNSALAFLTFPFLLWAAFRFGMRGASASSALVAFVAIQSVAQLSGPFRAPSLGENVWLLQTFQAVSTVTALVVAALISESKLALSAYHASELRLRETQKYESLGIMAGGIAHDFNNLLSAILGHAELLTLKVSDRPDVALHAEAIQRAGERAADLCQQMVAFSGNGLVNGQPVRINDLLERTLKVVEPMVPQQVGLAVKFASNLPEVNAEPEQLQQVVINLIQNAVDAIDPGEGQIRIETGFRILTEEDMADNLPPLPVPPGEYVYFSVRDPGKGIPVEIQKHVFEPFYTTKFMGRGLGLAAVLGIVRTHQGTIHLDSDEGMGTLITVFLPVRQIPCASDTLPSASSRSSELHRCCLIIDDDDSVRDITMQLLEMEGFTTLTASNGLDGLRMFQENSAGIDVAVIDWMMPGMNGYDVAMNIRAMSPDQAIILTSGYTNQEVNLSLPGSGKTAFLPKPFRTNDLLEKIKFVSAQQSPEE